MRFLRTVLYVQSALLAGGGLALALVPRWVVVSLLGSTDVGDFGWVRLAGLQAFGFALVLVLIGHRVEELWWFVWASVVTSLAIATMSAINAAFLVPDGDSPLLWWLMTAGAVAIAATTLWGMSIAGNERPID